MLSENNEDQKDSKIAEHLNYKYNLSIRLKTVEFIKSECQIANKNEKCVIEIRGRDIKTGLPKTVQLSLEEINGLIK